MTTPFPFQSAAVLLASQLNAITTLVTSTKTASHTLTIADVSTRVIMNSASATTITVNTSIFGASDIVEILNIGAGVCTVTAGSCTVGTSGTLALAQNAGGTLTFISASASVFRADGVSSSNKVAQVLSTTKTDSFTVSTGTATDVTGLSVAITPSLSSSKILVIAYISCSVSNTDGDVAHFTLAGGNTSTFIGDAASLRTRTAHFVRRPADSATVAATNMPGTLVFLDSPSTTSATTYKVQAKTGGSGSGFINRTGIDTDAASFARTVSTITVMEILA